MPRIVYSKKIFGIVFFLMYIAAGYITYGFSYENILYGTVALAILLGYIAYFSTRPYIGISDAVAAIVLSSTAILLGLVTGIVLGGTNTLAAGLYTFTTTVLLLGIVYSISKYLL